jgi:hypothetical protein
LHGLRNMTNTNNSVVIRREPPSQIVGKDLDSFNLSDNGIVHYVSGMDFSGGLDLPRADLDDLVISVAIGGKFDEANIPESLQCVDQASLRQYVDYFINKSTIKLSAEAGAIYKEVRSGAFNGAKITQGLSFMEIKDGNNTYTITLKTVQTLGLPDLENLLLALKDIHITIDPESNDVRQVLYESADWLRSCAPTMRSQK